VSKRRNGICSQRGGGKGSGGAGERGREKKERGECCIGLGGEKRCEVRDGDEGRGRDRG